MASIKRLKTTEDFRQERLTQGGKVGLINLGCARNLVDAQDLLGRLKRSGHRIVEMSQADVAVVNTCSFIEEAKKESIDTIIDLLDLKKQGKLKKVIVAGCLAQRYGKELAAEFPQTDAVIGTPRFTKDGQAASVSLTPKHFAYVKICESCYNRCRFCIIPAIKGKFSSRTIESICAEIEALDRKGVKEINLIGQDITAYGMDLYHEYSLARLLKTLAGNLRNIRWLRLLYAFPAHVTDGLIDVMASQPSVCKYIDLPLQHISDDILSRMNRGITTQGTKDLIRKIRQNIPQGSLRTTFIVGLPGETEENFEELVEFVRETRFEKVGVFVYSREEGTPAYDMPDQVPAAVKRRRMDRLMRVQQEISTEIQNGFIGRELDLLIEEKQKDSEDIFLGRSEYDAPEVDGVVYVRSPRPLAAGDMVRVKITDAYEYDLSGDMIDEPRAVA